MAELLRTSDKFYVALNNKRDVVVTPPWLAKSQNSYAPRPGNVVQPLIKGERAFAAVYEAINNAKKNGGHHQLGLRSEHAIAAAKRRAVGRTA